MDEVPSEREQPSPGTQLLSESFLETTAAQHTVQDLYSVQSVLEPQPFSFLIPNTHQPLRRFSPQPPQATIPILSQRGVPDSFLSSFDLVPRVSMSRHSSSSARQSSPQSPQYQLLSSGSPADQAKALSQNNKDQLIDSLRKHKVNTITELRRIEKIFAYLDSSEVTEPMTSAWAYYVNSNSLLNELRGLTRTIPFSSECLDEGKALVVSDPASVRSWNYCWLVLVKIEKENLIMKYARALASKKSTWGNRQPTAEDARRFITACIAEWTRALAQMLRHWDEPPSTTGN